MSFQDKELDDISQRLQRGEKVTRKEIEKLTGLSPSTQRRYEKITGAKPQSLTKKKRSEGEQ